MTEFLEIYTMYAIIKTGSKQYRVKKGDVIDVELLHAAEQEKVEFSDVLFVHDGTAALVGKPIVEGYRVLGEVVGEAAGPKVISFKYKRRQGQRTKKGHRQKYTRVMISDIVGA